MFILSFTPAQVSSAVWNAITRSLTVDPATDAGAATLVWGHGVRTLTNLFGGGVSTTMNGFVSLAGGLLVDFTPPVSQVIDISCAWVTIAAGSAQFGFYQGGPLQVMATTGASNTGVRRDVCNHNLGLALNNTSGAVTLTYSMAQIIYS